MTSPSHDDLFGTHRPDVEADDWDDKDLLTKDEARHRVEQTIRVTARELERARVSQPERVPQLELYMQRAQAVLEHIAKQPAFTDAAGDNRRGR